MYKSLKELEKWLCHILYCIVTQTFVTLPPKQKKSHLFPKYLSVFLNA